MALLIDECTSSDGDLLAHNFVAMGLGPTIGARTWGGCMVSDESEPLVDGGAVGFPSSAIYSAPVPASASASASASATPTAAAAGEDGSINAGGPACSTYLSYMYVLVAARQIHLDFYDMPIHGSGWFNQL